MAKMVINKDSQTFFGEVNTSSRTTFGLKVNSTIQSFKPLTIRKVLAFTLAETLIVMGIIGVVAALTIPNLNSSTGDKEKVVKVKKIYSNLNDAIGRAQAVYGPVEEWVNGKTAEQKKFNIL